MASPYPALSAGGIPGGGCRGLGHRVAGAQQLVRKADKGESLGPSLLPLQSPAWPELLSCPPVTARPSLRSNPAPFHLKVCPHFASCAWNTWVCLTRHMQRKRGDTAGVGEKLGTECSRSGSCHTSGQCLISPAPPHQPVLPHSQEPSSSWKSCPTLAS